MKKPIYNWARKQMRGEQREYPMWERVLAWLFLAFMVFVILRGIGVL